MGDICAKPSLALRRQIYEVRKPDDDWTGLKNAAERRKRQTRLNVRAYRRRKAGQLQDPYSGPDSQPSTERLDAPADDVLPVWYTNELPWISSECQPVRCWNKIDIDLLLNPLPIDQRLITLVRYNVVRAVSTNMSILSIDRIMVQDECTLVMGNIELFPAPPTVPESLMPTVLQSAVPHESWIDLLPSPALRDNIIRLWGTFDTNEYMTDAADALGSGTSAETAGMLVWTDPWHVRGWELTEGFVKKWRRLLEGCSEMIEATNRWRVLRGEEPLLVDVA